MGFKKRVGKLNLFSKILWVNLPLLLILLVTFLAVSGYTKAELDAEIASANARNLQEFETDVETEKIRLKNLMILCADEANFILSLSGKQESVFIKHGVNASKQLSAIKFSLPYATQVFAYSAIQKKFIMSGNTIISKGAFLSTFEKELAPQELIPDFEQLKNGYYIFKRFVLYVINVQDYGFICVQFEPDKFVNSISRDGYEMLVLTEKNQIFATSFSEEFDPTIAVDTSTLNPKDIYKVKDNSYNILGSANPSTGYKYYLLSPTDTYWNNYFQGTSLLVLGAVIVLVISALIVLLNTEIYKPIKLLVSKLSTEKSGDEILIIQSEISNLSLRNQEMSKQVSTLKKIEHDIALTCLLHAKEPIDSAVLESLRLAYPSYTVIYAVFQGKDGTVSKAELEKLTDALCSTHGCMALKYDEFSYLYLWQQLIVGSDIDTEVISALSEKIGSGVLIGVSNICSDIANVRQATDEAIFAAEAIKVRDTRGSVIVKCYNEVESMLSSHSISLEQQSSFANAVLTLSPKDIAFQLEKLLFSGESATIGTVRASYSMIVSLRDVICETANISAPKSDLNKSVPYNPEYIFNILQKEFSMINSRYQEERGDLKYQVTDFINEHIYLEDMSVGFVSEHFNLTPNYFSTWFKKSVGCTFVSYLSSARMEIAKKILTENRSIKISQVSEKVGISSIITFNRQFKAYVGTTPEQFRKQQRSVASDEQ